MMPQAATNPKQQAHELIDRMSTGQVSAVVSLLEVMLDPVSIALANAPLEDEPIGDEETRAAAASNAWLKDNPPIPNEEVLAGLGLTPEDFERMGRAPLEPEANHPGQ
jgi:hypothetical protein